MNVISPSFHILEHLDQLSIAARIEYCGRLCYKSEKNIHPESALPFLERIIAHGHNSVLEMAVLTLEIQAKEEIILEFFLSQPKYVQASRISGGLLLTASIRAWRELLLFYPCCEIVQAACATIAQNHPYFFNDIKNPLSDPAVRVRKLALEEVEQMPSALFAQHRHVAVKFVVNRAVTHELVRHRPCGFLQESQRYCRYSEEKFGNEVTFIRPLFWAEDSTEYALWQQAMEASERVYLQLLETSTPQAARTVLPNSCKTEIIVFANLEQWQHIFKLRCSKAADPSMREVLVPLREEFAKRFFPTPSNHHIHYGTE
jgi:thymidylate synthase (FAD)